jgi:hypothetical protein
MKDPIEFGTDLATTPINIFFSFAVREVFKNKNDTNEKLVSAVILEKASLSWFSDGIDVFSLVLAIFIFMQW